MYKKAYSDKVAQNVVPFFYYKAKILDTNPFNRNIDFLKDLDQTRPECIHDAYKLTSSVMIRSHGAGDLSNPTSKDKLPASKH